MASPLAGPHILLRPTPVSPETRAAFAPYQWCTDFLDSASLTPVQTLHENPRLGIDIRFLTKALNTPRVLRASQSFSEPRTANPDGPDGPDGPSARLSGVYHTLYLLGEDAGGWPGSIHGGLIATLLDQQAGSFVITDPSMGFPRTVYCNVRYRRVVSVPGAVRARAWKDRVEGRKHFIRAELVDGQGEVLASAETLFVNTDGRLKQHI